MSGKSEKGEKSQKVPRDRAKSAKDRESVSDMPIDSLKLDDDLNKLVSPKSTKKPKKTGDKESPASSVRFEAAEERQVSREKVRDRTSSAGPILGTEGYTKADSEDAEVLMQLFNGFVVQMNGPLANIVRRNRELKDQVKTLLKAAKTDEMPFLGMAREKDSLAREYDQMRYEHQLLQQELLQSKQQYSDLLAINQQLSLENASLKEKLGINDPATNLSALSSGALSVSGSSTASSTTASTGTTGAGKEIAPSTSPAPISFSFTRRRDNVAELEQSILDLEEEIKSPRSMGSAHGASDGEKTPTKPKRRITTKSHSNETPNPQTITQSSSTPGTSAPMRAKAPPERVASAPLGSKSAVNSRGAGHGRLGSDDLEDGVPPQEVPPTPPHPTGPNKQDSKTGMASPNTASSPSPPVSRPVTAEDREEARLLKYLNGTRPRSNQNLGGHKVTTANRGSSQLSDP